MRLKGRCYFLLFSAILGVVSNHTTIMPFPAIPEDTRLKGRKNFTVFETRRLGGGSCSVVVLGEDNITKDAVAVKIVDLAASQRGRGLVHESSNPEREIRALSYLSTGNHPNITGIEGFWQEGVTVSIAAPLCEGGTLHTYLQSGVDTNSGHEAKIVRRLLAEVILGLTFLEERGVVHRDIKPENILLTESRHAKITDFGSSILAVDIEGSGFAGSPEYAPPEMLANSQTAGTPSDIWSLGCIVFETHSGKPPFDCETEVQLFEKIKACETNPFAAYAPNDAKELVQSILVSNPEARPTLKEIRSHDYFSSVEWVNLHEYCNISVLNANFTTCLQRYLYLGESVVHSGTVSKTRHLSTKIRLLVATTLPRLFYVDPVSEAIKGTVPLQGAYASVVDDTKFEVHTSKRVYKFQDPSNQAHTWAGKINDIVKP